VTRIAVVGGGITGLAAAWELTRGGAEAVVLEGERHAGGVIVTQRREGFVVEGGPDGFLAAEPDLQQLAEEIGVADRLVDQLARGSFLWTGRRLEPLSEGRAAALLGIHGIAQEELHKGFRSFAGGMADIIEALVARLGPAVLYANGVTSVVPSRSGYRIALTGGSVLEAEGVILAAPAWVAARLLAGLGVPQARELDEVVYHPSVTVSLAYRNDVVPGTLGGTGFVAGPESGGAVRACTYASRKYPGRAPEGSLLLRAFLAPGDGDPAAVAHAQLAQILGLSAPPMWARAFSLARGLPRYKPHHPEHIAELRRQLIRLPPVAIAGAGIDGAGVSACVRSGRDAARTVLGRIGTMQHA
jgi:protoporphyrinogen/coproporphyrinogen III oxidase